tara:strand:+ start:6017 stop:6877 length:861 start_codon:yes stop_codon:yes gene_type:complete
MSNSQTIISIRRDKVEELRELNRRVPNFFKMFMKFHSVSNFPLYLGDSIFVSHSEHSSIVSCHIITPFLGSTFTNIIHKAYTKKEANGKKEWNDRQKIIKNLIMGFKGVFTVDNIEKLEIESDFATAKNSVYSVFGLKDEDMKSLTAEDFEIILDITSFKYKERQKEQQLIDSLPKHIDYLGSFAQRQACLAFQSDGVFKAYPFKSNKNINFDLEKIKQEFKEEAIELNHRMAFVSKEEKEQMLLQYVSSFDFRDKLSNRLFEAFINGLKGKAIKIEAITEPEIVK